MHRKGNNLKNLRPEMVMTLGFSILILVGSVLLSLPVSGRNGRFLHWTDALFTATSAVCVTGLVAVDTGTTFSLFGRAVLLVLIQAGGLGFMILASLAMQVMGQKLSLRTRLLMRESMNTDTLSGLGSMARRNAVMVAAIEGTGMLLISIRMIPRFGVGHGLMHALFLSVSAFCNAGFDCFGYYQSLTAYSGDALMLLTISALIILGGIGFPVIAEVTGHPGKWKKWSLHTRITLSASGILLAAGTVLFYFCERENPRTLGNRALGEQILGAFFQSVTMRTAGFNSVDLAGLRGASKLFACLLMLVGASPASTGGGMKTTTVAAVILYIVSIVRGREDVNLSGKRLPQRLIRQSIAIVAIAAGVFFTGLLALSLLEGNRFALSDLTMEMASAVATVGVSAIGTPRLHATSRAVLIPVMFLGRVGPLTLMMALSGRPDTVHNRIHYPQEDLFIG
ncbi:MAG: Trk family potassium uptake protein [Clostridia bacterium]|nr:Trk family potassium uptake protein [Clostridia bacterium]